MNKRRLKSIFTDFTFLIPALILFCTVVVVPFFMGSYYAFTDWDGVSKTHTFIGFQNFTRMLDDPRIWGDIKNTLWFTVMQTTSVNVLGLALAMALRRATRFNKFLRTTFFAPFICSIVFASFIWKHIFREMEAVTGLINPLSMMGTANLGVAIIALWRDAGYAMVIYLAALQAIDKSLYETAEIDGAGPVKRFFNITLPMIVPALTTNITLYIGWGLKSFDYQMAATGGGPAKASETVAMLIYYYTFPFYKAALGQALALTMMLAIVIITSLITRALRSKEVQV